MTEHDVLVGFRLRLFTLADELGNVSAACRAMGVDRSTYYRLKRRVDRWGLEALNVRERRRPRMPNQIGPHLEQRIIAFSLGHPAYGPRRIDHDPHPAALEDRHDLVAAARRLQRDDIARGEALREDLKRVNARRDPARRPNAA